MPIAETGGVRVSTSFGIVVRKQSALREGISYQDLLELMECTAPFDENDEFLSFGPHFGGEAADEFTARLTRRGLDYWDDFIDFHAALPDWCEVWFSTKS